jgi:ABC-type transport system substrate-binding protein
MQVESDKRAVSRALVAGVVVLIILVAGIALYFAMTSKAPISSSSQSSSSTQTSSSTTTATQVPTTMVYETAATPEYLDPGVSYFSYDYNILQNVYEPLLYYNGSCSTCVIPWLAQSYTTSSDLKTYNFTLRSGITFADGEPLNSTAVYFSLNRLLLFDGSTPKAHGTQASWLLWQLINNSLSSTLCGCTIKYGSSYVNETLAENFVQITGPLTFTIHVNNPTSAVPYLLAGQWANILAPNYVMQHDLALWNKSSTGYTLPYPKLSGSLMRKIKEYFMDLSATCNASTTKNGCGDTYLNTSAQGSLAGTGPYTIVSNDVTKNIITLKARQDYWGGPYQYSNGQKIVPKITTVVFKYVPDQTTREIDLQNAARSGQAMAIDVANTNLYDVVDRRAWLTNNTLVSVIPGVSVYGPYTLYSTLFDPFNTNVSNPLTGQYYKFQPFADIRFRKAFADSVNMTAIWLTIDNKIDKVAINVVPPGLPPEGSYNSNIKPIYSYNPVEAQNLLLDAMMHPITRFNFENGTTAPPGLFNNTFGCKQLNSNGQCSNPVPQTISLYFSTGDTVDEAIFNQIAATINNISATYNMGLTVTVTPLPSGQLLSEAFASHTAFYMYALGWIDDYPWVLDFLGPMYAPNQAYPGPDGWNLPVMQNLYNQAVKATQNGNVSGLVAVSNKMNQIANQEVMYLWTFYSSNFITMTSNVKGFFFNPSLSTAGGGGVGPEYFATLYISK